MTEIKTRQLRPFECFDDNISDFNLYIRNGDRMLEPGDSIIFAGHNGDHVQLLVRDRSNMQRWINIVSDLVFLEVGSCP